MAIEGASPVLIVLIMVGLLDGAGSFLQETIIEAAITAAIRTDIVLSAFLIVCLSKRVLDFYCYTLLSEYKNQKRIPLKQMRCLQLS